MSQNNSSLIERLFAAGAHFGFTWLCLRKGLGATDKEKTAEGDEKKRAEHYLHVRIDRIISKNISMLKKESVLFS